MSANLLIYNNNEDLTKFHLLAEGVIICMRVYVSVYIYICIRFYTIYLYTCSGIHLSLIDSLLDFRNSSNADNDNELDSDTYNGKVPVQ